VDVSARLVLLEQLKSWPELPIGRIDLPKRLGHLPLVVGQHVFVRVTYAQHQVFELL
jgi:hypothetical protein